MLILKRKVYAYVTHRNRLLVFAHPNSLEVGIQVLGGALESGGLLCERSEVADFEPKSLPVYDEGPWVINDDSRSQSE